ncbi:MAG TPA: ABC transporter substrate-binding protein [Methylomirabilota bacterium]|nr:ABC transporter substrate-binding protein [Methylomirabilota bacterium]
MRISVSVDPQAPGEPTTRRRALAVFARCTIAGLAGHLAVPGALRAQPRARTPRIGILSSASASTPGLILPALRDGLREAGHIDGQTIVFEVRHAEVRPERLPALAADLVRLNVDVIVTTGDAEVRAARAATAAIPIVMAVSGDPVRAGYVESLARPGGNVTGLSFLSPDLSAKLLELLKEAVPTVSRVAVLWNAANPVKALDYQDAERAARSLHLHLRSVEVRRTEDFDGAFAAIARDRPHALVVLVDEFVNQHPKLIGDFVTSRGLPAIAADRRHSAAGVLLSYGPSLPALARRAAGYVDRILKGEKPANLPVEQPTTFDLVVNLRTAQALGITLPPGILGRADEVIR